MTSVGPQYLRLNALARPLPLLLLHGTVLIWGFTGILGKLITAPTLQLVYMRTVIGLLGMVAVALWMRRFAFAALTRPSQLPLSRA
jgi:hypothetical protein